MHLSWMWLLDLFCEYTHKFPRQNAFLLRTCDLFCLHVGLTPKSIQNDKAHGIHCCNPSLGLVTKAKACKGCGLRGKPGSEGKCERMNLHTPKGASTLGVEVPLDSQIFKEQLQGSKPNGLKSSLYHWKILKTKMFKLGSHNPFGHLKHKLWPKERPEVKLAIWLLTTKSQELPQFSGMQVACNIPLKISQRGLQLCFRPNFNMRSTREVMGPQSRGSPNCWNFRTPIWESRDKMTFGWWSHG